MHRNETRKEKEIGRRNKRSPPPTSLAVARDMSAKRRGLKSLAVLGSRYSNRCLGASVPELKESQRNARISDKTKKTKGATGTLPPASRRGEQRVDCQCLVSCIVDIAAGGSETLYRVEGNGSKLWPATLPFAAREVVCSGCKSRP